MDQSLCKLTLVGPPHGADQIIELLLAHEPPLQGFTTWEAEGHGFGFAASSLREKIRGSVERRVIVAVVTRSMAQALISLIAEKAPLPHLTYWIEPVHGFGQMALAGGA